MDWLINTVYYVVPFLVLLGVLVFVHELGHYLAAKLSGVKVDEFSVGFGKELWGFDDRSGTHWKVSAIPLGGYCKFLGDGDATSSTEDEALQSISAEDKKYAFAFQNPFKKLAIVLAGPGANYLFAILVFASIFFFMGKFTFPPVVGEVMKGSPAEMAGMKANDRVLKINGVKIDSFDEISREIMLIHDNQANLEIDRGGKILKLKVVLKKMKADENAEERPMLGVKSVNVIEISKQNLSLLESVKLATLETYNLTYATLRGVGQMVTGKRSGDEIGGIIRIAEMSGDISKKQGWLDFVVFMALLSVNLGLINLFPIPVLDGGHVVIYSIEIVARREISAKLKEILFKIGLSLILALMVFATWNDFARLFNRWFS